MPVGTSPLVYMTVEYRGQARGVWGATAVSRGSTDEVEILISVLEAQSEQNSLTVRECTAFIVLVYSGNSWFRSLTLKAIDQPFVCWLPCLYHQAIIALTLVVVRNK